MLNIINKIFLYRPIRSNSIQLPSCFIVCCLLLVNEVFLNIIFLYHLVSARDRTRTITISGCGFLNKLSIFTILFLCFFYPCDRTVGIQGHFFYLFYKLVFLGRLHVNMRSFCFLYKMLLFVYHYV